MMVLKNSKSVFYGQWTILLMLTCFGIFKYRQKLKLRCRDEGIKLFHIKTRPHNVFSKFQKQYMCTLDCTHIGYVFWNFQNQMETRLTVS